MKNLARLFTLAAVSLGFSSCCSLFGWTSQNAGTVTETRQVKSCGYDIVKEEIMVPASSVSNNNRKSNRQISSQHANVPSFGRVAPSQSYKYDELTEANDIASSAKSGKETMVVQVIEKKVPRCKTITKKKKIRCGSCTRFSCPKKDCCGTTSESVLKLSTAQGATGSPHIGLVPTMKPLAP